MILNWILSVFENILNNPSLKKTTWPLDVQKYTCTPVYQEAEVCQCSFVPAGLCTHVHNRSLSLSTTPWQLKHLAVPRKHMLLCIM